jgi:apolipoprotein N-acyltransferase
MNHQNRYTLLVHAALGALLALGLPPLAWLWLVVIALSALLLITSRTSSLPLGQAFLRGWAFGFGYFCVALHWIGYAFLVDATTYLWMMPFAVGGLALFLASYWGLGFLVTEWLVRRGFMRWVTLACMLSLMEMLRGYLLTGFPWAAPGLMADASLPVLQVASLVGMPGLTVLVLLWGMAPAAMWLKGSGRLFGALVLLSLPAVWLWGNNRTNDIGVGAESRPLVRAVQPNISQSDKWRRMQRPHLQRCYA